MRFSATTLTLICAATIAASPAPVAPTAASTFAPNRIDASDVGPPPNLSLVRRVQAAGEQLYRCSTGAAGTFAWTLVGPKALLFNEDGSDFGTHSAGPRWTATDGSSIVADGAHPLTRVERNGSVPALLLHVMTTTGSGILTGVQAVTRTETAGGVAPAGGCDALHDQATVGERYTAVYSFYR